MNTTYLRLETRRVLRNPRMFMFTVAMPVLYFFLFNGLYGDGKADVTAYLMGGMAAFGAMMGTLSTGARTAEERKLGWQRQLRLTPMSPGQYLLGKGIVGMAVGLIPIVLVTLCGALSGVHLEGAGWLQMIGGVWLSAIPFAALGLLVGQLATTQSLQVYTMIIMLVSGFLGGLWIPPTVFPHWLTNISQALPSYWMANIGHGAVTHDTDTVHAIVALSVWTVALGVAVMARYRRDSARR